ncbi:hypothetical protein RHGRI_002739 [Rhododendron griersonianum]|uniref:GPI transamidase component PIG-S n=1 Tax=Rhododendron griersonianum TaxID=479676 RepID=A0AAV6LTB3_9ERIC|nr:hypothetical protein RHGRI_002739 [Rhododendron griersonianum]
MSNESLAMYRSVRATTSRTSTNFASPIPPSTFMSLVCNVITNNLLGVFCIGSALIITSCPIYRVPNRARVTAAADVKILNFRPRFPMKFYLLFRKSFPCLPFLLKSIEIYRAPLPFRDIDSLSGSIESAPLAFPCQVNKFTGDDRLDDDEVVDEYLESALRGSEGCGYGGKVYTVVVVKRDEEVRAVVGKHRHAWIVGRVSEVDAVEKVAEIFIRVFVNGGKEGGVIPGEFMPVGADGKVVLSFNLLNADPDDWVYDWDFQKVDEILLTPVIEALGPVANISVESQVLYHTPKSSFSYWDGELESYIFSTKDLPFFVNSNEWHLDTSIAAGGRSKVLHVVVYVPSAKECPLLLQLPNGEISRTNSFISPMWGGVIVWNPPGCSTNSETMHLLGNKISHQDLEKVFEVFMGQLRQLFGLKSNNLYLGASGTFVLLASERGFTEWELDVLSRQHTCFNLLSCATTLGSLSRLVQSLPRMIIKDEIGKQVKFSLEAANLAQSNASLGIYEASAVSSRQARSLAEDAFFHPSIMSVSYYSFEHCFAVYSPFFLPVSLHVILAAVREWRRFKTEQKKYVAWKTKDGR